MICVKKNPFWDQDLEPTHGKNLSVSEEGENETEMKRIHPSGLTFNVKERKSMIQCADSGLNNGRCRRKYNQGTVSLWTAWIKTAFLGTGEMVQTSQANERVPHSLACEAVGHGCDWESKYHGKQRTWVIKLFFPSWNKSCINRGISKISPMKDTNHHDIPVPCISVPEDNKKGQPLHLDCEQQYVMFNLLGPDS